MKKLGLLVRLEAKAGKEKNVEEFITSALPLANVEKTVKLTTTFQSKLTIDFGAN